MREDDEKLDRALQLHEQSAGLRAAGDLESAETLCREALALFEEIDGPVHPDVANLLHAIGEILEQQGRHADAEACAARAVAIMDEVAHLVEGPEARQIHIQALDLLGAALRQSGRYREAEPPLLRAIELGETQPDRAILANSLNNLGVLYKYSGKFDEAGRIYRRALAINLELHGERHVATAAIYHNLGGLEHARGRFQEGEDPARRAWEIRRELLGPEHPDALADACAYAGVLDGLERFAESRPIYERALKVWESIRSESRYAPAHFELAATLHNLAALEAAEGNSARAEQLYRRALAIKQERLGPEHPECALTANNLGTVLRGRGDSEGAAGQFRYALRIFEATLDADHPHLALARSNASVNPPILVNYRP